MGALSLRVRLVLLVLIPSIPVLALSIYTAREVRRMQIADAKADVVAVATRAAEEMRSSVEDNRHLLAIISRVPAIARGDPAECRKIFTGVLQATRRSVNYLVIDAQGRPLCHSEGRMESRTFADRDYFRKARDAQDFVVGDPIIGRTSGRPALPMAYPLHDEHGAFSGMLVSAIDLRAAGEEIAQHRTPRDVVLTIWRDDGTILYRNPSPERWTGFRKPGSGITRALLSRVEDTQITETTGLDGTPVLLAMVGAEKWLRGSRLAITVGVPLERIYGGADKVFRRTLAWSAGIFAFALAAALLLGEFAIRRKAAALADASARLGRGDLSARTGLAHSDDELGRVAQSFDRMARSLQLTTRTLRVVSEGAQAVVQAKDETALLQEICRIAVEDGGYRSCWAGYAQDDDTKSIRLVAQCGVDRGYVASLGLTWAAREGPLVPNGEAIRRRAPVVVSDTRTDELDEHWRRHALSRAMLSYAVLPIFARGEVIGELAISSGEPGRFQTAEVDMLQELSADLGYGIDALRTHAAFDRQTQDLESLVSERTSQLQAANRFLDSVIENIPDMIFVKEARDLRFVRFNRAGEELIGHSRSELVGKSDFDFFPREQAQFFVERDRVALAARQMVEIAQEPIETSRGTRILHTKKIPVLDESGAPQYLLGISRDITAEREHERKILSLNATLAKRASELDAANRELETFSYSVSHDLRAPLRHVQGYVEMLTAAAGDRLDEKARRYLQVISDSAEEMGELIDGLLAFSRTSRTEMLRSTVDMAALVEECIRTLEPTARGRNIEWRVAPLPSVAGDPRLLRLVWTNLLGNAIKYTRKRDPAVIEVGSRREENGPLVMFVRDNGVGFDMKYAAKLFGVFQRLHRSDEFEGTGIGLATVQRIVVRHGGRIWAQAAPEAGATFFFTLAERPAGGDNLEGPSS